MEMPGSVGAALTARRDHADSTLLPVGATLSVQPLDEAIGVRCYAGELWITQEGRGEDFVIRGGEAWLSHRRGRVVIEALRPACFAIDGVAHCDSLAPLRGAAATL